MKLKVNKMDVARRQLCSAVKMYFKNYDMIAIHTIVFAAFHVTRSLCGKAGAKTFCEELVAKYIKPGKAKVFIDALNKTGNYFKHADRDPVEEHGYDYQETENLLMFAIGQYRQLSDEDIPEFRVYEYWHQMSRPNFYKRPEEHMTILSSIANDYEGNRQEFYRDCLAALQRRED